MALRDVGGGDIDVFYKHQLDPAAIWMAAFTSRNPEGRDAFDSHWRKVLDDRSNTVKTILFNGGIAGHVAKYIDEGRPEVTYWIDRALWGKGIATDALLKFLAIVAVCPIFARAARDNIASLTVLKKCGFVITGDGTGYANGRRGEVEEFVLRLD